MKQNSRPGKGDILKKDPIRSLTEIDAIILQDLYGKHNSFCDLINGGIKRSEKGPKDVPPPRIRDLPDEEQFPGSG